MRTLISRSLLLLAVFAAVLGASGCALLNRDLTPGKVSAPKELLGVWEGTARVIVSTYTNNHDDSIAVRLRILPGGDVMGSIGDASLRRAYLTENRGWLGRFYSEDTNYMISANVVGELIGGTDIEWGSAAIPLNLRDGLISGEIHIRGQDTIDDADAVQFSATDMELRPE